jgi:phosphatidylserine decarboxylase
MRGVPFRWRVLLRLLTRLPQGLLSRAWGAVADYPFPGPLQKGLNGAFVRLVGIDVSESEFPAQEYRTLSALFSRALRDGVRPWSDRSNLLASPVDGVLGPFGRLEKGLALQAKGMSYRATELLGCSDAVGSAESEGRFESGLYFTIYLSPRHYHRIHAPFGGDIPRATAVPGRLLPVNLAATRSVRDLFPRNERLILFLETPSIRSALVAIGAFNVGRISARFDPSWASGANPGVTNRRARREIETRRYEPPLFAAGGDEVMAFHFGSTVVLLVEGVPEGAPLPPPNPALREGEEIRVGTPLLESHPSTSGEG